MQFFSSVVNAPGNSPAFLAVNVGNPIVAPYDLSAIFGVDPSCTGQMNGTGMVILQWTTGGTGALNWSFAIPNNNVFGDLTISAQGLFLDFFEHQ